MSTVRFAVASRLVRHTANRYGWLVGKYHAPGELLLLDRTGSCTLSFKPVAVVLNGRLYETYEVVRTCWSRGWSEYSTCELSAFGSVSVVNAFRAVTANLRAFGMMHVIEARSVQRHRFVAVGL